MQYRTTKVSRSKTMPNIFNTLHNTGKSTKIAPWFAFHNLVHAWPIAIATVILINSVNMCVGKKLNASQAFDNTWSTATDLENELECVSSQQKRSAKNTPYSNGGGNIGPWSPWSEWSTCSRTCDGGVMQQIRRCQNINGCKGESVRYRICNMQPCPEQQDFRARQCSAYNDVPYDGTLYKWSPHYDYVEPCALTCRGRPAHLNDDSSPENTAEDGEHYDELNVVVQLSPRVQDGTRCRSGSLDMCIQGKCLRVGCDLKIGSTKRVDGCGLCGGDGSSCSQALHQWEIASISLCSVSCGGGYKMSHVVCRNRVSGVEVEDALCNVANRPEPTVELCNTHTCPPRWIADEWGPCSRLCGPGVRERMVVCAEENNGIKTRVADIMCSLPKPALQDQCILEECPKWEIEEWTECSVSCGQGIQMRGVECKSPDGRLSAKCDPVTKPSSVQQCANIITCDGSTSSDGGGTIIVGNSNPRDVTSNGKIHPDMEEHTDEDDGEEDEDDSADVEDDNISTDDGLDGSTYNDQPLAYSHNTLNRLHQEETDGPKTMRLTANNGGYGARHQEYENENEPSEPTYIKDNEWSQCSVTCGEGIRRRTYRCKIFLEYSRTLAIVNDSLCEGSRPHDEVERCVEEPCMLPSHGYEEHYPRDAIKVGVSEPGKTYVWREQGYTSCSASCLGGVEELIINCVREDNGRVVSPFLCAPETKPESRVRTCNDRPCPPRWNYSDYTPCSKSCGIGIKTREVQCIHEVTRGGDNTMVVPNSMCPQPPPADRQYCNVLDCPVRWEVGEWSKCSHTCGYGIKERKVECKQIMAQEHKIERPESMCPSARPSDKKPCNVKPCPPEDPKPVIQISNTTHIQHDPKKSKITLKVGGAGVVFFGTQVKIKCPVKRYNRTKIKWSKDHKPLIKSRKFKVSKKGALRILDITFRDAGVYSCHAGLSSAEIQIDVKAKPGQQSEDPDNRRDSDRLVRERSGLEALTAADMTASDNRTQTSHRKHQQQQQQQLNGRERSGRKIDGVQHADSSRMEDEHSQLMQRAQDGLPQSATVSSGGTGRHTNALLAMPYFQTLLANLQYLWPSLQKFSNSRGHGILANRDWLYGMDFEQEDEPHQSSQTTSQVSNKDTRLGSSLTATVSAMSSLPKPPLVDDINSALNVNTNSNRDVDVDVDVDVDMDADVDVDVDVDMHVNETSGFKENAQTTTIASSLHLPHARWPNHWTNAQVLNTNYDESEKATATTATTATTTTKTGASFITYKWQMSPWSECSQKCDAFGTGLRRRTATCIRVHFVNDKSDAVSMASEASTTLEQEVVENVFCETYGLNKLTTSETCSTAGNGCAHWYKGEWTLCHRSRCYGPNTAVQKRKVSCRYANDTLATTCSEYEKPLNRQECYNERCKGVWRVESWSECNAPCGRQGIKYRILQCVWYGTRRPAGNSCKHQPRPAVMKVCKSPPCFAKALRQQHCEDTSRYCRNVRTMGLCRLYRYQEKCCKSCQPHYYHNIPN